ncbi:MAG: hypothetical protein H7Y30_00410, partial [Pyrinomonadaceae bacterium]|nr:hypothetical protein [Pyrinomonadaceae bacterium]
AHIRDESNVTATEKEEIQSFARRFVGRMLETRDVAPLIKEFFLDDFTSFFEHDYFEKVSPQLYSELSEEERERLFIAQNNLCYFITLLVWSEPESKRSQELSFARILPDSVAWKLDSSRLVEGVADFFDREDFLKELKQLEEALSEARDTLAKKKLEQTPQFQTSIAPHEQHDCGIHYRVRGYVLEENIKDKDGTLRFAIGQKIYRIETPIMYGITLIKEGNRLKIVGLDPADGD